MDIHNLQVSLQDDISLMGDTPELLEGQIHLWWADLSIYHSQADKFIRFLDEDEIQRAVAFRQDRDRDNFCIQQGILRLLLSGYITTPAQAIKFRKAQHGKSYLAGDEVFIRFNLSRSADYALFVVRRDSEVGVDIEKIHPLEDWKAVAERVFAKIELNQLKKAKPMQRMNRFFQLWVRKEAYLKARGYGFQIEPQAVAILPSVDDASKGWMVFQDEHLEQDWQIFDLSAPPGYIAALCVQV